MNKSDQSLAVAVVAVSLATAAFTAMRHLSPQALAAFTAKIRTVITANAESDFPPNRLAADILQDWLRVNFGEAEAAHHALDDPGAKAN